MIYVAEVEGRAVAGFDAEYADEARDFLLPAVEAMTRRMFEENMEYRFDETAPVTTRTASPEKAAIWRTQAAKKMPGPSSVVWFFPVPK
jgi:hypothetical protein